MRLLAPLQSRPRFNLVAASPFAGPGTRLPSLLSRPKWWRDEELVKDDVARNSLFWAAREEVKTWAGKSFCIGGDRRQRRRWGVACRLSPLLLRLVWVICLHLFT